MKKDRNSQLLGLYRDMHKDIDFDATYKLVKGGPDRFKITGYNSRAHQYPFILSPINGNGKGFKANAAQIKGSAFTVA
jgi:hypothetical protein